MISHEGRQSFNDFPENLKKKQRGTMGFYSIFFSQFLGFFFDEK